MNENRRQSRLLHQSSNGELERSYLPALRLLRVKRFRGEVGESIRCGIVAGQTAMDRRAAYQARQTESAVFGPVSLPTSFVGDAQDMVSGIKRRNSPLLAHPATISPFVLSQYGFMIGTEIPNRPSNSFHRRCRTDVLSVY